MSCLARNRSAAETARDRYTGDKAFALFTSHHRQPLTRFGIYKIVKRHTTMLRPVRCHGQRHGISPHVFRHSTAVSLLEAGADINVIRGWLGHVSLDTTNRYAEITLRAKQAAVLACLPPVDSVSACPASAGWRQDQELMKWLQSL